MTKFYFTLVLILLLPILVPVLIVESTIAIPITLYAYVRFKLKRLI